MSRRQRSIRKILESLFEKQNGICFYCGDPVVLNDGTNAYNMHINVGMVFTNPYLATLDHKVPKSKFGVTDAGNSVCACYECNQNKDSLEFETFLSMEKSSHRKQLWNQFSYMLDLEKEIQ